MTDTKPREFEKVTCSRCGGSGQYSYCQMYGKTCFKCGGTGKSLTKRGHAAVLFYRALLTVKAKDVKPGMWLVSEGCPGFSKTVAYKVETVEPRADMGSSLKDGVMVVSPPGIAITGKTAKGEMHGITTWPEFDVRIAPTKAGRAEAIAKALDYQDTLTKAGTVRKTKPVAEASA